MGACAVCGRPATTKGLCDAHYQRLRRYGRPDYKPPSRARPREQRPDMLTGEQVKYIQAQRGLIPPTDLAAQLHTSVRTVIAIQAGRNWGWLAK